VPTVMLLVLPSVSSEVSVHTGAERR
jgi:hypothetical protein